MYLHENREQFVDAINLAVYKTGFAPEIIEKDYYVTMVLRELSKQVSYVVFKGGTSLQKCHRVISRFSEDIDITIDHPLTQGQKKELKKTITEIAALLGLTIPNLTDVRSRRDYNRYELAYDSVLDKQTDMVKPTVLLETSFSEVSFPTVVLPVHSYIGDLFAEEAPDMQGEYKLSPFSMKVQSIDRTLIDKVFAICDYYIKGNEKNHSRHIYDIYKLAPLINQDDAFRKLVKDVRSVRAETNICPSAQPGVDITALLKEIVAKDIYKEDYNTLTVRLLKDNVSYNEALSAIISIVNSESFNE